MTTLLKVTELYSINIETATSIEWLGDDIKIYIPAIVDEDLIGDELGDLLPGIELDFGLITRSDCAVFVSPTAEKYEALKQWIKRNTL